MSSFPYLRKILGDHYMPYRQVPRRIRQHKYPDYALFIAKPLGREAAFMGQWPPPNTIYTVKADNTVLCAVVENARNP